MRIRGFEGGDLESVVRLSLRAWAPVFDSIEQGMDTAVFQYFFPDWQVEQRNAVAAVFADKEAHVWVCDSDGVVVGFVAVYQRQPTYGEIYMIAVDPDAQKQGVGRALIDHALNWMRENGVIVAMVETGGDPGHAPARRLYERAGFRLWPVARYYSLAANQRPTA